MYRGRFTLLLIAVGLVPVALKKAKPLAKDLGEALVKAGESLKKLAEEAVSTGQKPAASNSEGTPAAVDSPNEEMKNPKDTTKTGAATKDIELDTVSPIGHEEVESQIAAEQMNETEPPEPKRPKTAKHKHDEPDQPLNPHNTENSRPD